MCTINKVPIRKKSGNILKALRSLAKLDYRLFQNVQDIRRRYKVNRVNCEKLENENDRRKTNFNRGENPEGIFQRDAISLLLFVIEMIPLNQILWKCTRDYKLTKSQEKINYTDDIKLFAKMKKNWRP